MSEMLFIFNITNNESSYALCDSFISKIERNAAIVKDDLLIDNEYFIEIMFCENIAQKTFSNIEQQKVSGVDGGYYLTENCLSKWSVHWENPAPNDHAFYFRVDSRNAKEDYEFINLQYYLLIKKNHKSDCYFTYITNNRGDHQRLSYFMYFENILSMDYWEVTFKKKQTKSKSQMKKNEYWQIEPSEYCRIRNQLYNRIFCLEFNDTTATAPILKRLNLVSIGTLNAFLPLLEINRENYLLFASPLNNIATMSDFKKESTDFREGLRIKNDFVYKIYKKIFNYENQVLIPVEEREQFGVKIVSLLLFDMCIDLLAKSKLLSAQNYEEKYFKFKNMSILSFLFFSVLYNAAYNREKNIPEADLDKLYYDAQDFADGILQIIDNAWKYSKYSFISFRVYSNEMYKKDYLERTYPNYYIDDKYNYLEVRVVDSIKDFSIPDQFKYNIEKRAELDGTSLILIELLKKNIELKSFFNPNDIEKKLWNSFYNNARNLTRHYGLQTFDLSVNANGGYFKVISSEKHKITPHEIYLGNYAPVDLNFENNESSLNHLPGTQYIVVLPLTEDKKQKNVGIDIALNYNDISLKEEWDMLYCHLGEMLGINPVLEDDYIIKQYSDKLDELCIQNTVVVFEANAITNIKQIELFTKALITFIITNRNSTIRIGIIKAEREFIISFTRYFAVFYDKIGENELFSNTQIYISNYDYSSEIVFAGSKLASAVGSSQHLARAKGEFSEALNILNRILLKRKLEPDKVEIAPFDILIKNEQGLSLFESKVFNALNRDIQQKDFGCCLKDIHMKVGSKIHVKDVFFEAELLFNSSQYTSRFAYITAKMISKLDIDSSCDLVLVGYEDYSEITVYEVQRMLSSLYKINAKYIIYKQQKKAAFKLIENISSHSKFVIIVPINSTLSTHKKIEAELSNNLKGFTKSDILANIALVLIRDKNEKNQSGVYRDLIDPKNLTATEKRYWNLFHYKERLVYTKITNPAQVNYLVCVESDWDDPLRCKSCFPTDPMNERPIIEANKSSVIPMILVGLIDETNNRRETPPWKS